MRTTITLAALLLVAGLGSSDTQATTYHVDVRAVGARDGTSWPNAFRELQEALHLAAPGDTILVAEGGYEPDWDPVTDTYTNDREDTFHLKNGVEILGGFPTGGDGPRDPLAHPTYLTGNIGLLGSFEDNSLHVVTAGPGIDGSAVLDGFVVVEGEATNGFPHDRGGGIRIMNASPFLRNVRVELNFGLSGAGIYVENGSPILEDVTITTNFALAGSGAGMWNYGGAPIITGALFSVNQATEEGGGLFSQLGTPYIVTSRFVGNSAVRGGAFSNGPGGVSFLVSVEMRGNVATEDVGGAISSLEGLLFLNNVTLSANSAAFEGGGLYSFNGNTVGIHNSIIWGNTNGDVDGALSSASNSVIGGGYPGTNILDADPRFRGPGDLRLHQLSPALDAADVTTCAGFDLRGFARGNACDIGAYEYLGTPGTWWSNGEADLSHAGPAVVEPVFSLSLDDFFVQPGTFCDVTGLRAMMLDPTPTADATFALWSDNGTTPGLPYASWAVQAHCAGDPTIACGQASDCPGSWCVFPGQSFGPTNEGTLWAPRVDFPNAVRFLPGRYWVSVHGTLEPGSSGSPYWVAAATEGWWWQGYPYVWCSTELGCVTGGGDTPRDLVLDVDAQCYFDADGDGSAAGVDCDESNPNRYPGAAEVCDGIDNDCDAIADGGQAPSTSPTLFVTRALLAWTPVPNATGYDVVRGSLSDLRGTGGDFTTAGCDADDVVGTLYEIPNATPHGLGIWYLVRAASPCGNSSYDDGSPSQAESRDAEIVAGGNACP